MIMIASLHCHYKSLTPSKSMLQKSNHDIWGKYPYVRVGILEPMIIKEISTKNSWFFAVRHRFRIRPRHIMTLKTKG